MILMALYACKTVTILTWQMTPNIPFSTLEPAEILPQMKLPFTCRGPAPHRMKEDKDALLLPSIESVILSGQPQARLGLQFFSFQGLRDEPLTCFEGVE